MHIITLLKTWLGLTMADIYMPINIFVMFFLLKIITRFSSLRALLVSFFINALAIVIYSTLVWATNYETFLFFRFEGKLTSYLTLMAGVQIVLQGILFIIFHSLYAVRIKHLLVVALMSNFYTYLCMLFLVTNSALV